MSNVEFLRSRGYTPLQIDAHLARLAREARGRAVGLTAPALPKPLPVKAAPPPAATTKARRRRHALNVPPPYKPRRNNLLWHIPRSETVPISYTVRADEIEAVEECDYVTTAHVQEIVAREFNVSVEALTGPKRWALIALPRHVAIYLCIRLAGRSTTVLAKRFGGRDHTTILHGLRRIRRMMAADQDFAARVERLEAECLK